MMKHTYYITGMTCNGCRASVEKTLKAVTGVTNVVVSLEKEEAVITMNKHIATQDLKRALPEKYTLIDNSSKNVFDADPTVRQSKLKQLFPLFLILAYILIASFLLNFREWIASSFMLDFMGLFYIVFSFFKFLDVKGFKESFAMYDPLARAIPTYGFIYPFVEAGLGLMFLMRFEIPFALIATLIVLGITTIGVTRVLLSKKAIQCACLGTALKLPMTEATFIENAIMIVMAIVMLIQYI